MYLKCRNSQGSPCYWIVSFPATVQRGQFSRLWRFFAVSRLRECKEYNDSPEKWGKLYSTNTAQRGLDFQYIWSWGEVDKQISNIENLYKHLEEFEKGIKLKK